jgi:putative transcriptional regulator
VNTESAPIARSPREVASGPRSHFGEDLILACTVGAASDGAALAVACHLDLCPSCRGLATDLELIGEALFTRESAPPRPELLTRILDDAAAQAQAQAPARRIPETLMTSLPRVPGPLVDALATVDRPRWRWLAPGIHAITLVQQGASVVRLLRLRPGLVIPSHDHGGSEHTVVFAGGLDDAQVRLGRGDALTMEPGDHHRQMAAPGADCIALVVNEAPPRPLTLGGRILKRIARL